MLRTLLTFATLTASGCTLYFDGGHSHDRPDAAAPAPDAWVPDDAPWILDAVDPWPDAPPWSWPDASVPLCDAGVPPHFDGGDEHPLPLDGGVYSDADEHPLPLDGGAFSDADEHPLPLDGGAYP